MEIVVCVFAVLLLIVKIIEYVETSNRLKRLKSEVEEKNKLLNGFNEACKIINESHQKIMKDKLDRLNKVKDNQRR